MFSFALSTYIGEVDVFGTAGMLRYSWIMWLFVPVGILSILIGIKLKKNNQKYKKNLIIAFVCVPLLLIFGSYRFLFNDTVSYDDIDTIYAVEETINLNLPNEIKVATTKFDSPTESYNEIRAKIINNESKVNFEQEIETNPLWQNELGTKIKSLWPTMPQYEVEFYDYFIFYNITTGEYNTYPTDGIYECVLIAYDCDLQGLIIVDNYTIYVD